MSLLGVLALDTAFQRIIGDVGNANSYPFPAEVVIVDGADATVIVRDSMPEDVLMERFIEAAKDLEKRGARAIVSTCGFLITSQKRIAASVKIPVMLSALSLYPVVAAICPGRVGILTASRKALGPAALAAAGIGADKVAIGGMDSEPTFAKTFLAKREEQMKELDRDAMEKAVCKAAVELKDANPDLSAILLECGNLPPYAAAIRKATGLPVFHLLDAAAMMMAANSKG